MNSLGELQRGGDFDIGYFVPSGPFFLRAGAAGAMVAGGWTAFSDVLRVRDQEITSRRGHFPRDQECGVGGRGRRSDRRRGPSRQSLSGDRCRCGAGRRRRRALPGRPEPERKAIKRRRPAQARAREKRRR